MLGLDYVQSRLRRRGRYGERSGAGQWYEGSEAAPVNAVAAYACFRVGYHRGLDALRRNGWNGSQSVRWEDEPNRGFLRCVSGLARMAGRLGELPEAERCARFLIDLDPDWPPSTGDGGTGGLVD